MLTYPEFDPIIFSIGPLAIRWYGLMYVLGFVAAWILAIRRSKKSWSVIKTNQVDDLIFYAMIGVIVGGRLGYCIVYGWEFWLQDPLYLFKITQGGMSFHGGLVGVMTALWLYGRRIGNSMWQMTDFAAPLVPIGLGTGRIGNFINGELWGGPSDLPWAMKVQCNPDNWGRVDLCENKLGMAPGTMEMTPALHPSMLYEAALEGLVLFLILWFFSNQRRPHRAVSGMFLLWYGVFRVFIEFFRIPDTDKGYILYGWVTQGQILSAPMILAGAILLFLAYRNKTNTEVVA